jgi:putative endonuclease
MADIRRSLGTYSEDHAARYLARQGYTIVARQWRCRVGEIDLIAHDGNELVFVEVRSRRGNHSALESVGHRKQQRLVQLAQTYCVLQNLPETTNWRIDVIAIQLGGDGDLRSLEHLRSAVEL